MSKRKSGSKTPWGVIIGILAVVAVAVGVRLWLWQDSGHGPIGGPFTLVAGDGKTVTDRDFRGQWLLIYFGYTFCPDVCPTSLSLAVSALEKLPPQVESKITPLFITVDPSRDTPAVMKDYVTAFHPRMVGLTGSEAQVKAAISAYRVYASRAKSDDPSAYTMDHSSILYLVGPDGKFVTHFSHGVAADDIAQVLKQKVQ